MENNPTPTLALALRPQHLDAIVGQQSVVAAIKKIFESGRQPVAWLFSGPTGTGKSTLALIVARMVQGPDFTGEPEIETVNGADRNGVDDIRELIERSHTYPLSGHRKVVILNEAQKLTDSAQDCLLEPLEQQDSPTIWVMTTTEVQKIKPALQGRCSRHFLTGLGPIDRTKLVEKAFEQLNWMPINGLTAAHFIEATEKAGLNLPREILNAVERFAAGTSAEEACAAPEDVRSDFIAISKATVAGNWLKLRELLKPIRPSDSLALRGMVANYLRALLLEAEPGPRGDVYCACITMAYQYTEGFSSGVTHPGTVAWLYKVCELIDKAKKAVNKGGA